MKLKSITHEHYTLNRQNLFKEGQQNHKKYTTVNSTVSGHRQFRVTFRIRYLFNPSTSISIF